MRGVDSEGQVANYVETEQIIEYQGEKCSFVQVCLNIVYLRIASISKPQINPNKLRIHMKRYLKESKM